MNDSRPLSRRRLLGRCGAVAALGALAGCVGGDDSGDTGSDDLNETENRDDPADDDSNNGDGEASLDLREANVVGVEFGSEGGDYQFDVTLQHNDNGEEGYANWWQVERLDGTRLGRRELLHAHSQQPFTRSETVEIPEKTRCVVVRGHDQTHGYGGQAATVSLDSGGLRLVDQGPASGLFETGDCPE